MPADGRCDLIRLLKGCRPQGHIGVGMMFEKFQWRHRESIPGTSFHITVLRIVNPCNAICGHNVLEKYVATIFTVDVSRVNMCSSNWKGKSRSPQRLLNTYPANVENMVIIIIIIIIIKFFYSLWSIGHPWRASRHCGLQLSPLPRSMIFLCFLSHPLLSFATFSSAYLSYIPEDSNLMQFPLLLLFLYVMCVQSKSIFFFLSDFLLNSDGWFSIALRS